VFRQLVAGGIVDIDLGGWGSILLNQHSKAVLKGERPVMLRKDLPKSRGRQKRARTGTVTTRSHSFRPSLYEELRLLRKKLADERRVPAYVIFHDATLIEMAEKTPRTVEAMQQITGVGERKLESFGDDFLRLIQQHAPTGGE
jgi:ATP-dependent DNA helicase RecQ